jgi:hypothetical protein
MPSKSVGGRKLAGGFDSRPPPQPKRASNSGVPAPGERAAAGKARSGPRTTASTTQVFRCFLRPAPDKSPDRPPEDRTSLRPPSCRTKGGSGMVCSRWTTDGVTCPPAGSFALHRGHRAGVVPALAHVLLVRRVTRVLATVVAAELLARLDPASAPHGLVCSPATSKPTGVPASTRRTSQPALLVQSSLGARAARRGNRLASARPDCLDRRRT